MVLSIEAVSKTGAKVVAMSNNELVSHFIEQGLQLDKGLFCHTEIVLQPPIS